MTEKGGITLQKDRAAQAFCTYADRVLRASFHITGSRSEAEDCTQEAFLRLLAQSDTMEDAHILPWLLRTVINLSKDYIRSARHRRRVPIEEIRRMTTASPLTTSEETALYAVMQLPEKYRLPLYLHLAEGYTMEEVASILKMNTNTVSTRIRRARQKLQKEMDPPNTIRRKG